MKQVKWAVTSNIFNMLGNIESRTIKIDEHVTNFGTILMIRIVSRLIENSATWTYYVKDKTWLGK